MKRLLWLFGRDSTVSRCLTCAAMSRRIAAHLLRFLRPPRPGFALPASQLGRHAPGVNSLQSHPRGGGAAHGPSAQYLATRLPLSTIVIIGHRLRRARAYPPLLFRGPTGSDVSGGGGRRGVLGGERYTGAELGVDVGAAVGMNGYGFPMPSRVISGDGVPQGSVLSHWRVDSSSLQSRDGRGADGGRLGVEEGELPWIRSQASARALSRSASFARRRLRSSRVVARRAYRRLKRCAHRARPPLSWPDSANIAALAHRHRRSRRCAVAKSSRPGGVTGRDRRVASSVTSRDVGRVTIQPDSVTTRNHRPSSHTAG